MADKGCTALSRNTMFRSPEQSLLKGREDSKANAKRKGMDVVSSWSERQQEKRFVHKIKFSKADEDKGEG